MDTRQCVFSMLMKMHRDNAYSNIVLKTALQLPQFDNRDKAFASALFYGVIERKITLDYQLSRVLKQPLKRLRPEVLEALRMGVYQLYFMDKVPASAAINESVKLIKKNKCAYASALVNASLRNVERSGLVLPDENSADYLSVKYSFPQHIINLWTSAYGEDAAIKIMESSLEKPKVTVRVNTLKISAEKLMEILKNEGVRAEINPTVSDSLILSDTGSVAALKSFGDGLYHVQDSASQICAKLLGAKTSERIFDPCAAPGGKSFTVAQEMKNGEITACDLYEGRVKLIADGAKRLGIDFIKSVQNDAAIYNPSLGEFDRVLCDVPCSGLGIIRRKPEIKYKSAAQIKNSAENQYIILENSYKYLKTKGVLLYSTCTLNPAENEETVERFAAEHKMKITYEKTFFTHIDATDGFFAAVMQNE